MGHEHSIGPGIKGKMMGVHQGSKHLLLLISLFFVVLGSLMLTVLVLTKPWVKRPQVIHQRMRRPVPSIEREKEPAIPKAVETKRVEKEPLEAVTQEYGKTPTGETGYRDAVFRREIVAADRKVMEEKPTAIPRQEKRAPQGVQEESEKEIPQSPSTTRKVAELEKEREFETAMSERKSIPHPAQIRDSAVSDEAHSQREHGAPSDLKDKGISVARPTKSSSLPAEGEGRVIRPKLPSPFATDEEVRRFFVDYVERYNRKDIDGFLSLFSPSAIQNQREGFDEIRRIYSDFFKRSRKLRYHLEDMKIKVNQNGAEARGHYTLVQKKKRRWKEKVWKGDIRWVLVRENGALKIRYLDYTPEKSP